MKIKTYLQLVFAFIFLIGAWKIKISSTKSPIKISKQESSLNFNTKLISIFSAGQRRLASDLLWITTLLDSDHDHYKKKDLNSWMYLRFLSISELDPLFLQNYKFGGQYLSIVKDDLKGAEKILSKGLKYYSNDYDLLNAIAFLYAFELQDYSKAYKYYERVSRSPKAPAFVESLLLKLKFSETRNIELARDLIIEKIKTVQDPIILRKLNTEYYSIQAQIDLECLNNNKDGCNKKDILGNDYTFENGKYKAQTEFTPYTLYNN